ncbi:hypothetical protein PRIPAC_76805 [Pristionchus pacificus]|uniref:Uncharacterized protein n=1 Tax=Pristionchus pacificus TaxID=54126 RepID=A0A2A6BEC5_PRIPA|nr:hypothetical protein PRIPAC_76805 [Pristionchus pacificus]|eukprot:PDM64161.1 hypothetical protein PRIPAC_54405 [Pristionchus pacificus]
MQNLTSESALRTVRPRNLCLTSVHDLFLLVFNSFYRMAAAGGDGEPPEHNYDPYHKEGPDPAEDFDDLKPEKRARLISIPKRTAPLEKQTAASVKKDLKKKNEGTLSSGDASSSTSNPNKREHLTSSSSTDSGPDAKISRRASNVSY